jgi:hypothetical protein
LRIARTIGHLSTWAFQWSPAAIMNLLTKLEIIGLGVMVLMLLGVAVLMLWYS